MSERTGTAPSVASGRGRARSFLAAHGLRILVAALIARRLWYHSAWITSPELARAPEPVFLRLGFQLALAALCLWLFHRSVRGQFGRSAADLSLSVLLAYPELAFFENKALPVAIGIACNVSALWAICRLLPQDGGGASEAEVGRVAGVSMRSLLLAGFCSGLSVLATPYMLVGLPFGLCALWILARFRRREAGPRMVVFLLGLALASGIEALRELVIGPHPASLSLAGMLETARGLTSLPAAWDRERLWSAIGNDLWRRDASLSEEVERSFVIHHIGLPFGALLALGCLGLSALLRRAVRVRGERAQRIALALILAGQIAALLVLSASSASVANRVALGVPLAFVAGPALLALFLRRGSVRSAAWQVGWVALLGSALLFVQAFWPRG